MQKLTINGLELEFDDVFDSEAEHQTGSEDGCSHAGGENTDHGRKESESG